MDLFAKMSFLPKFESLCTSNQKPSFGDGMKKEFSLKFDEGITYCNQGGKGVVPNRVLAYK